MSNDQTTMRARSAPQVSIASQGTDTQSTEAPTPIVSASGFEGLQLTDGQMTYSIAVRTADGGVRIQHAQGGREANRQVLAGANGGMTADKERVVDR